MLKKKSISAFWPMTAFIIYFLAGTIRDIKTRITNEVIVYSTPGYSTIGIRTGKILNVYSDTAFVGAEVKRHCATLGLKLLMNRIASNNSFILAGNTRILFADSLNKTIIDTFSPDIVILTGSRPVVDFTPDAGLQSVMTLIVSEGSPHFRSSSAKRSPELYPVYLVKKSGAFIRRI